ncbi:MAG: hypothetical protein PHO08_07005 [Methylococcales bacterium]|nr:hypothetical protein [Methylococcales bacterium]
MPICQIIAGPNGAGKTTLGGQTMTITSVPPSAEAQTILNALQQAVAKNLEKKRRLWQYAVTWKTAGPSKSETMRRTRRVRALRMIRAGKSKALDLHAINAIIFAIQQF